MSISKYLEAFNNGLPWNQNQRSSFLPEINQSAYKGAMEAVGQQANSAASSLFNSGQPSVGANPSFMDSLTGWTGKDGVQHNGWGGLALGAGQGILGGWMGMQQMKQAEEQFDESKRQFNLNYDANKKMTNSRLEDRQRARVASNKGAYQSVGKYMNKNGV